MTEAKYDKIAKQYAETQNKRLLRTCIIDPAFLDAMGDVREGNVLDMACGSGFITRQIKQAGARRVIGIDISPEMIKLAQEEEERRPLGIEYKVGDARDHRLLGSFDLVVGSFLLHYAESKNELRAMCHNLYDNLKVGGRLIAINQNPDCPFIDHIEYGSRVKPIGRLREGGKVEVKTYADGKETCSFENFHWERSTYNQILENVGFKDIKWTTPRVSQQGIDRFGEEFWEGWYESPVINIIEAKK